MDLDENGTYGNFTEVVQDPVKENLKQAIQWLLPIILVLIMLGMGCDIEWKVLKVHIKRPIGPVIGAACQFIVMPLLAFSLAHALQLSADRALGLLILGCCPGGTVSNMFTYWNDGDVPLSVFMTTCSTILAFGMMPLNLFIYSRSWTDDVVVPFLKIFITLLTVVIPAGIGVLIRWKLPKIAKRLVQVASGCGMVSILIVIVCQIILYPHIFTSEWKIWIAAVLLPFVGIILGYAFSAAACQTAKCCRTIAFETGSQNVAIALTLIAISFSPDRGAYIISIPVLSIVTMVVNPSVITVIYKIFMCWKIQKANRIEIEESEPKAISIIKFNINGNYNTSYQ
ncbi:ileal sodium/bile acid cotransporter-like isoform X1 [Lingula anatina]|uniref:Ileal sodium/bile acid cotransporter-like isoform X1 n=1 Tax=Lingula anatina TaxID=7574 RepID=A0A1S3IMK5_LINAN|nr:ileal sodium/bile acid cotransporter-like isoform X1 [Lingula anatina]|eukprot:XP_013399432.1 ileal sodium/bile acid cotransporter-like isoform X1 [Lingula anatina]